MSYSSLVSAVTLSRGSTWNPGPGDSPYLLAVADRWPDDGTAQAVFYDTAGTTLATIDGTVTPTMISFTAAPDVVDAIPNGANFEIFLTTDSKPYQIRYGKVIRREAQFTGAPDSVLHPLEFTDSWPTLGLRSAWVVPFGIEVFNNSGVSLPNGVSAYNTGSVTNGVMRWYKPLATDTVSVKVSTLNQHAYQPSSWAKMRVILAANVALTSYLAVEFVASANSGGTHDNGINFCTGTGPASLVQQTTGPSNVVADGDSYTIHYDDATAELSVYKGTDTTPLGSWVDSTHIVPHGPGFRYVGLSFYNSASSDGIQATAWQAMDTI